MNGRAFVIHQPNGPSGGRLRHVELGAFLSDGTGKPEQQALLRLIGTLVDVPPYADRMDSREPTSMTLTHQTGLR